MIEDIKPLYLSPAFSQRAIDIVGKKIFRHDILGFRVYSDKAKNNYMSLTTLLSNTMPTPKALIKWRDKVMEDFSGDAQLVDEFVEMTADFGTYLHIACADYVRNGSVNWGDFETDARQWLLHNGFKNEVLYMAAQELMSDFAAIAQFLRDYDVKVHAVELPVSYKNVMTCNDLVVDKLVRPIVADTEAERIDKIQDAKRHNAIINLKSGKKGFFDTHLIQLAGERECFNATYGGVFPSIDVCINVAPKDWIKAPTYKVKEYTFDEINHAKQQFLQYYRTAEINGLFERKRNTTKMFYGDMVYGDDPSAFVRVVDVAEIVFNNEINV